MTALLWARPSAAEHQGWIGNWEPGIGDPTFGGWLTVACYCLAAYLCFRVARALPVAQRREGRVWFGLFGVLVAMGINKQLDLQSALTEVGRVLVVGQGWQQHKYLLQRGFIVGVATAAVLVSIVLVRLTRSLPGPTRTAVFGWVGLLAFVAIRAASFHHFDVFIGSRLFGLAANWLLEIGGSLIICLGALLRLRRTPSH